MDKSKNPKEWLRRSKSCLKIAQSYKDEDIYLEDLCFNAQQSVEKALKALIVHLDLEILRTQKENSCSRQYHQCY